MSRLGPLGVPGTVCRESAHERAAREADEFRERMAHREKHGWEVPELRKLRLPKAAKATRIVVMGDAHAHPDTPNHRFEAASNFIATRKPDVVVDMGDSADMGSLLHCDKKGSDPHFEGLRYHEDVEAYIDAKIRLGKAIPKGTRLVKVTGNHEDRINRLIAHDLKFAGFVHMTDLRDVALGWELYPYLEPVLIEGVAFVHAWKLPGARNPMGGEMVSKRVLDKFPGTFSRVQGHTHTYQHTERAVGVGEGRVVSIAAGCFFDPDASPHRWAGRDVHSWRPGLLELTVARKQIVDFAFTGLETILREYL